MDRMGGRREELSSITLKKKSLNNSNVNSSHLVLCRQGGDEVVLGDLGSFQNKGEKKEKKLTTKRRKCPRVFHSASFCMDPGTRKQLRPQLYLWRDALGELVLPEAFSGHFLACTTRRW